jgi:hypothetical protein
MSDYVSAVAGNVTRSALRAIAYRQATSTSSLMIKVGFEGG